MLTDAASRLTGIFTDSDLARLLESGGPSQLVHPICQFMTKQFQTIDRTRPLPEAMQLLGQFKISELPVLNETGRPVGIVDVTDVVNVMSPASSAKEPSGCSSTPNILPMKPDRPPGARSP